MYYHCNEAYYIGSKRIQQKHVQSSCALKNNIKSCRNRWISHIHPHRCQLRYTELLHGSWWFVHVRRTWRNIRLRSNDSLQHRADDPVMGSYQDFLSGQQLVFQLRGDSECFPHLDNILTTAPFAYNTSVPELNLAVIKQTVRKQKLEVIYGCEMAPIHVTAPLSHLTSWICLFFFKPKHTDFFLF